LRLRTNLICSQANRYILITSEAQSVGLGLVLSMTESFSKQDNITVLTYKNTADKPTNKDICLTKEIVMGKIWVTCSSVVLAGVNIHCDYMCYWVYFSEYYCQAK